MSNFILAGDIGGTNTRLALFEITRRRPLVLRRRKEVTNAGRRGVEPIIRAFVDSLPHRPSIACFGVAGPVKEGRAELTNLEWSLDERELSRLLDIPFVRLINDLVAHAEGINLLRSDDLVRLHRGRPVRGGNRVILAPGTGLGEGGLVFDPRSGEYLAFASEGGHCDFSPRDDRQIALLRYLRGRAGRCSWEDVLSGPGLRQIFHFLTSDGEFRIKRGLASKDPTPADITRAAAQGACRACISAVELFATFYGAEAGNLALKVLATGGVYLGGGIAPHIVPFLRRPAVRKAFCDKGPREIQTLLRNMPLYVITTQDNALYGAAYYVLKLSCRPGSSRIPASSWSAACDSSSRLGSRRSSGAIRSR